MVVDRVSGQARGMTPPLQLDDIPRGAVIVGVDGSDGSDRALDWAADTAARQHRTLAVVHTEAPYVPWNASGYPSAVEESVELRDAVLAAGRGYTAAARAHALERHPDLDVVETSDVIDARLGLAAASLRAHTLVVGSRGRGPLKTLLLGSVSVSVTREPSCPVVVVRPSRPGTERADGAPVLALVDGTSASAAVLEYAARHASEVGSALRITHLLWTSFDIDRRLVGEAERLLSEIGRAHV